MNQPPITYKSGGVDVSVKLFSPPGAGTYPLVIMAYGTGGMMPPFDSMYIKFGEGLAKAGFFAGEGGEFAHLDGVGRRAGL